MEKRLFLYTGLVIALAITLAGMALAAEGYNISWAVIGGGGGQSSGGGYSVSITIGQPIAATSSGGEYAVCTGFWCGNTSGWHLYLPEMRKSR